MIKVLNWYLADLTSNNDVYFQTLYIMNDISVHTNILFREYLVETV